MKRDIKLIITDLDGTLIDGRQKITPRDLKTLEELKKRNVLVAAATGRGKRSADGVTQGLPLSEYLICFQGAALFKKEEVLWHQKVGNCLAFLEKVRELKEANVGVFIEHVPGVEDLSVIAPVYATNIDYLTRQGGQLVTGEELQKAAAKDLTKMVYFAKLQDLTEVENEWKKIGANKHIVLSSDYTLDITHAKAKKSVAARYLANLLGFSMENVLALGDNYNDADLIASAGYGVAMSSAPEEVKKIADYVTKTAEESGFSDAVAKFLDVG